MENTGYIALSRQTALWRRMDTIANNLANMNTSGFRGQDMMFTDYLVRTPNTDSAFRDQVRFVQDIGQVNNLTPGPQKSTGNAMDLALQGDDTFFAVEAFGGFEMNVRGAWRPVSPLTRVRRGVVYTPSTAEQIAILEAMGRDKDMARIKALRAVL